MSEFSGFYGVYVDMYLNSSKEELYDFFCGVADEWLRNFSKNFVTYKEYTVYIGKSWFDLYFNDNLEDKNMYFVVLENEFKGNDEYEDDIYNKVYSAMYESFYDVFKEYDVNEIIGTDGIYVWDKYVSTSKDIYYIRNVDVNLLDKDDLFEFIGEYSIGERNTKEYIYGRIYKFNNEYYNVYMYYKRNTGFGYVGYVWDYEIIDEDEVKELLEDYGI